MDWMLCVFVLFSFCVCKYKQVYDINQTFGNNIAVGTILEHLAEGFLYYYFCLLGLTCKSWGGFASSSQPLGCYISFFLLSFYHCSFGGQKNEKPRHTGATVAHSSCSRIALLAISLVRHSLAASILSAVCRVLRENVANERNASLLAGCTASAAHLS